MCEKREILCFRVKIKPLNYFHFKVYGLRSVVLSFQVMLNNEIFGFNKIQHEKPIVSRGTKKETVQPVPFLCTLIRD